MPGGLLNLSAWGTANIILNGNPKKTFFKAVYKKYTNFGMQRFRLDYEGQKTLSFSTDTEMEFKVKRYADLLWDTYVVVNLPDIWSPILLAPEGAPLTDASGNNPFGTPYEFKWIHNLGPLMIRRVTIHAGGTLLSQFSGEDMLAHIWRDEGGKRVLWDRMVGNTIELHTPEKAFQRTAYPNAVNLGSCPQPGYTPTPGGPPCVNNMNGQVNWPNTENGIEPSIRGRQLYIPLDAWFTYSSKLAVPLIALQYQELRIRIQFRPVSELYTILDTDPNSSNLGLRKAPDTASIYDQFWRFNQPPPDLSGNSVTYTNKRTDWNADIHLLSNYVFLGQDERRQFAANKHTYLIQEMHDHDFHGAAGSRRARIYSRNMVPDFMWRFRRSDVNKRNEWSNYTNWPWSESKLGFLTGAQPHPIAPIYDFLHYNSTPATAFTPSFPPGWINGTQTSPVSTLPGTLCTVCTPPPSITGQFQPENTRQIMIDAAWLFGGEYRETTHPAGLYNYMEKWLRTSGIAEDGLYIYPFAINTGRRTYQPSGAQNTNKWQYVELEYNTLEPPQDLSGNDVEVICDISGSIIGIRKNVPEMTKYNYDLRVFETRYNVVVIEGGRIGLMFAR